MKAFVVSVPGRCFLLLAALLLAAAGMASCGGGDAGGESAATFSKSYGGPGHDAARAAIQTSDGGYVFVGGFNQAGFNQSSRSELGGGELRNTKLDAHGDVEWQRTIADRSGSDTARDRRFNVVRATADGGYVVAGQASDRSSRGTTGDDIWVAKFDATVATSKWQAPADAWIAKW